MLLVTAAVFCGPLAADPIGYSVNSDAPLGDRLYAIDLATGSAQQRGPVVSLGDARTDTEGLAFAPDGALWAVDEDALKLFPVSTGNGVVDHTREVSLQGLSAPGNDFGLTFACSGDLYASSVRTQTLYRLGLDGSTSVVGSIGAMGANISALASIGEPARLYGLSNGLTSGGGADTRSLYEIDLQTGQASLIGALGNAAASYNQAGLSFDADGNLWAITDRRNVGGQDFGSQVLRIDVATGAGSVISQTTEVGFEALAVAPPAQCADNRPPPPPDGGDLDHLHGIPTLSHHGLLVTILLLLLAGAVTLRRP